MNWKKELNIYKNYHKNDEYGLLVCSNAEEIMELIESQGHTGFSFSQLANILIRLLKEKPLFPITDNPDEWGTEADNYVGNTSLQNNRCGNIFKHSDGTITDVERAVFVDTYNDNNSFWHSKRADEIVDKLFPITLPYMPEDKPYYVYGKDMFLDENGNDKTNENIGYYNYTIYEYLITPTGEKIEINEIVDEREK